MKKLVLLFAAVFAMTFVSCDQKGTQSSASGSDSIESVSPSTEGESPEVKESTDTNAGEQTTEGKTEENKTEA